MVCSAEITRVPRVTDKVVSATRFIPAPAQQIFDLLADPSMHSVLDGSGTVKHPLDGAPKRLSLGAKFGMSMKIGLPYRISNTVTAFDEPHHIAWKHAGEAVWDYRLEEIDGGTNVTESWDYGASAITACFVSLVGFPKRNQKSMEATLERIEGHVACPTSH